MSTGNALKEKMELASAKELLPGFDKERAWKELQPRLQQQKKKPAMYWAYAAGLLLCFAIGGYVVKQQMSGTKEEGTEMAKIAPVAPAIVPTTEPIATKPVEKTVIEKPAIANKPVQVAKTKVVKDVEPAVVKTEIKTNDAPVTEPVINKPGSDIAIQTPKPLVRKRAVHLLDIDNEDRAIAIENVRPIDYVQMSIAYTLFMKNIPEPLQQQF